MCLSLADAVREYDPGQHDPRADRAVALLARHECVALLASEPTRSAAEAFHMAVQSATWGGPSDGEDTAALTALRQAFMVAARADLLGTAVPSRNGQGAATGAAVAVTRRPSREP